PVSFRGGLHDHGLREPAPHGAAAESGSHKEPLHLAHALSHRPQRDTPQDQVPFAREEDRAARWSILAGKPRQLPLEILEREIEPERAGVFLEERAHEHKVLGDARGADLLERRLDVDHAGDLPPAAVPLIVLAFERDAGTRPVGLEVRGARELVYGDVLGAESQISRALLHAKLPHALHLRGGEHVRDVDPVMPVVPLRKHVLGNPGVDLVADDPATAAGAALVSIHRAFYFEGAPTVARYMWRRS